MSLLPSKSEIERDEPTPQVVGINEETEVFTVLRTETARTILSELHDEPTAASDVAEKVDTSIQNAQYHLEKLLDAGLVEVVDTWYSSKGREMKVYAPTGGPLTLVIGDTESTESCRQALAELHGH